MFAGAKDNARFPSKSRFPKKKRTNMSSQVQHGYDHPSEIVLSDMEREYLGLIAQGQHPSRIAATTGHDEKDIRDVLDGARAKLGATNLLNAVSTALLRGLIDRDI